MTTMVETHYVNQYKNTITLLSQQRKSKLEPLVTVQPAYGQGSVVADQFGTVTAKKQTVRHEDTKYSDTPRYRRWLTPETYYSAELVDGNDIVRLLTDPKSPLAEVHVAAMNRAKDSAILQAFFAAAATGELPTSGTTAYDTANDIAADIEVSGTPAGLTPAKLIAMQVKLLTNFVDAERPSAAIPPKGWGDMFGQTTFTSGDYNAAKPLASADPSMNIDYAGMTLVPIQHADFPVNGTTEWYIPVWVKSAITLGIWTELQVHVQKMPQKVDDWEVKVLARFAATRVDEAKVGRIKIKYA